MSGIFAIIPVKPLDEGKSRLRAILGPECRVELNRVLMTHAFDQACLFPGAGRTIVISRCAQVLRAARVRGMIGLREKGRDLNRALASAARVARVHHAAGVVILPVDLPFVRAEILKRIVAIHSRPVCVLGPDRHRTGTNLMYVSPVRDDIFRFGPGSFRRHRTVAARAGLRVVSCEEACIRLDVDKAADYRLWRATSSEGIG